MQGAGVTAMLVVVQFLQVSLNTMVKASFSKGMSNYVFVAYSNLLAFCFLLPSTIFYYRNKALPPISAWIIFRIFVIGVFSCSAQTFLYAGVRYGSPTLASAMEDINPAYTFILAIISRIEQLDLKLRSCQAKSIGTVVSIAGALTVTFYKGLPLTSHMLPNNFLGGTFLSSRQSEWLLGGFLLAAGNLSLSILLIIQTSTIKDYPAVLMLTTVCSSFAVILSAMVAFFAEKNPKAWILKPDMELVLIFYSAIFLICMRNVVQTWACHKKGPVYVAMFNPLGIIIALAMGVIFLGDTVYLGSMVGVAIIVCGFYAVIWGQAQEEKMGNEENGTCGFVSSSSSSSVFPLLHNKGEETSNSV